MSVGSVDVSQWNHALKAFPWNNKVLCVHANWIKMHSHDKHVQAIDWDSTGSFLHSFIWPLSIKSTSNQSESAEHVWENDPQFTAAVRSDNIGLHLVCRGVYHEATNSWLFLSLMRRWDSYFLWKGNAMDSNHFNNAMHWWDSETYVTCPWQSYLLGGMYPMGHEWLQWKLLNTIFSSRMSLACIACSS